ncbi:MAG: hypothetical protein HZC49_03605 [Nitrospirae bacterium]|nr:hypothetical protein [Nitrospirota bacterium]
MALQKYFEKHRADLVLLMFTVRNDIEDNVFPISGFNKTIKPTFWLEKGQISGPSEGWLEPTGPKLKLLLLWKFYIGEKIGESRMKLWEKDMLPPAYQGLKDYNGKVDYSWQEMWNRNPHDAFAGIEYERLDPSGTELTPRSELRLYGINLTRKLLSGIKTLVEKNNGHFIIFKEERPWELLDIAEEKVYYLNGKYYKLSLGQHHETLKDIFEGFEHYRIPLPMDRHTVSEQDEHLNPQAIDILMKELAFIIGTKDYFEKGNVF